MTHSPDICFFTSTMGDGGAQRTIANLATGFSELGYDVDLLLLHRCGPYLRDLPHQIRVIELPADRARNAVVPLVQYLRETVPDVFFSTMEYLNVVSLISAFISNTDTRIAIRTANIRSLPRDNSAPAQIQHLLAKALYRQADHHIALSRDARTDMMNVYGLSKSSIDVIHNPVRVSHIQSRAESPVELDFVDPDSQLLISVGRLSKQKDYPTLLHACKDISEHRDIELIILGKGSLRSELTELAADLNIDDIVHFLGFVDNPYAYMAKADAFVLSSRWEGFGHVLVESMSCGTPVVATSCPGGPSEILADGKYGELVPVGNPSELASAINRTLQSPPQKTAIVRRAQDFDYISITKQYESVLFYDGA